MSTKTGKRRGRRLNTTDEEHEKKDVEIIEDNQSNISTDTEKTDKNTSLKETKDDVKDVKDKEIKESPKKDEKIKDSPKKDENIENGDSAPPQTIENGSEEPPQEQKTNGEHPTNIENQISLDEPCDMEPLILLDSEEQELQFVSESEASEVDKSPILNRCKTRRSQTRNMPTPKTPKTLEDVCQLDLKVTKIEEEDKSELNDTISVESSFSERTQESDVTNASVLVNFGDTTRNIDITTTMDESTINASNFLDSTKDKSYGETLRCLTGRKTLRSNYDYKPRFYNSTIELSKDLTDSSGKYSTLRTGVKRKLESDDEKSPTFLSYLSPFKKTQRNELPSSTPKLTGFKFGGHEVTEKIEEKNKKWCSIM